MTGLRLMIDSTRNLTQRPGVGNRETVIFARMESRATSPRWTRAVWLVLGAGTVLRVIEFARVPPLSIDEAMLGLGVGTRSWGGLLHPLDYGQTGPPLFLWATRRAVGAGGVNEIALRAIPLVAGIALPFAVWSLGRRLLAPGGAALAAAFAAVAPILVQYARTARPYQTDALVTVGVVAVAAETLAAPTPGRGWWRLCGAGVVPLPASQPAIFVLAGVSAALAAAPAVRSVAGWARRLAAVALTWSGVCAGLYVALYRPVAAGPYMRQFWDAALLAPGTAGLPQRVPAIVRGLLFPLFVGSKPSYAVVALFVVLLAAGAIGLARRLGAPGVALVGGPLVALGGAAGLGAYPLAARLALFAAPLLFLLMAEGAVEVTSRLRPSWAARAAWAAVVAWIVLVAGIGATRPARSPELRPLVRELRRAIALSPGEPVYVLATAVPMWAFYTTDWTRPDTARLAWLSGVASPGGPAFHNAPGRGVPVRGEGAELVWRGEWWTELIGVPTGMQFRELTGFSQTAPDAGWAENEAARIVMAGRQPVWLLLAPIAGPEERQLVAGP